MSDVTCPFALERNQLITHNLEDKLQKIVSLVDNP